MTCDAIKFLLVDDNQENLVALEALLRRDGLQILMACSGAEALEMLLAHEVALALLDVQMPEMNGFELAELMRGAERTKHVPIIFVTAGSRDPQRVFKGYETGAVDFLFKPIDPHVLRSKADVFFELYRKRIELTDSLRLNEMFIGILGHDLRNPLGAIVQGAGILESLLSDDRQKKVVHRMTAAAERMSEMIAQLMDLTRARLAGGIGFMRARARVDIAELVRRTVDELAGGPREVVVEAAGDCATTGDPDRLLQLFSNLVANAIHHGAPASRVTVSIDCADRDLLVRVHNRGCIPAQILPALFDPFRGRSAASSSNGLGLGLFISQQIAVAHGGSIAVESTEAAGTTLTVRLPRRSPAPRAAGTGASSPFCRRRSRDPRPGPPRRRRRPRLRRDAR